LEPLHGYLLLAERLTQDAAKFGCGWNFGPAEADARPVAWLADELVRLWGNDAGWRRDAGEHPHEAHHLKLDAARARACLGWRPHLPLPRALEWIVEWYRGFRSGADIGRLTRAQIEHYHAMLQSGTDPASDERGQTGA
jgi:CDP-glucose 4,6-dehydratase